MKRGNGAVIIIIAIIIAIAIAGAYYLGVYNTDTDSSVTDFNSCVAAGFPILESYPMQCRTDDGRTFTQEISWQDDGVVLMKNRDSGDYACFGCGKTMCVDPAPVMEPADETEELHCNEEFEVIRN